MTIKKRSIYGGAFAVIITSSSSKSMKSVLIYVTKIIESAD